MKVPCKDCPDRHYKCHSECEKYIEYKKRCDDLRERDRLERVSRHIEIERKICIKEYNRKKYHTNKKW